MTVSVCVFDECFSMCVWWVFLSVCLSVRMYSDWLCVIIIVYLCDLCPWIGIVLDVWRWECMCYCISVLNCLCVCDCVCVYVLVSEFLVESVAKPFWCLCVVCGWLYYTRWFKLLTWLCGVVWCECVCLFVEIIREYNNVGALLFEDKIDYFNLLLPPCRPANDIRQFDCLAPKKKIKKWAKITKAICDESS